MKSKRKDFGQLKSMLSKTRTKIRASERVTSKKLEDHLKEISTDLQNVHTKFNKVVDCVLQLIERVEDIEKRVGKIEKVKNAQPPTQTYADTVLSRPGTSTDTRIEKLEYNSSEAERNRRHLEVTITPPNIDQKSPNLGENVKNFLLNDLKMEPREIDQNMQVRPIGGDKTVLIIFSSTKFKLFLYAARKLVNRDITDPKLKLYVNDNLTQYNYTLLMKLKWERKKLNEEGKPAFETTYSHEGKIYVKLKRTDDKYAAIHIKNSTCIEKLLNSIESAGNIENQTSNIENSQNER